MEKAQRKRNGSTIITAQPIQRLADRTTSLRRTRSRSMRQGEAVRNHSHRTESPIRLRRKKARDKILAGYVEVISTSGLTARKRKKGKCSVCGSMAHLTRECAQRYFPAPNSNPTRNNRQVLKVNKENLEESVVERKTEPNQTNRESRAKQKPGNKKQSKEGTQTCTRNIEADGLLEECSLPTSLGLTPATVASKAMIEWPNVWGELSSKYPIGSLFQLSPLAHPLQASLLYYQIEANKTPIVAMLDTGASHTFITYELADQIQAELKPLDDAITTTDFGGQKSSITTYGTYLVSFGIRFKDMLLLCYT